MKEFFLRPKVTLITVAIILAVILSGVYLYATLRPGVWLNDAFLFQQKDGSFQGSDAYAQYTMQIERHGENATFSISINDITRVYEVLHDGLEVQILQDGVQIFDGHLEVYGDSYSLKNDSDAPKEPTVIIRGSPESLFPSSGWLYSHTRSQELDVRGQPWMLAVAWFFAAILLLDICLPDLLFQLRYRWYVDGGEPSDYYRGMQKISRIVLLICISVILAMGFNRQ